METPKQIRPDRHPLPEELCVKTEFGHCKRDALLFDKIFVSTIDTSGWAKRVPEQLTFGVYDLDIRAHDKAVTEGLIDESLIVDAMREFGVDYVRNYRTRFISDLYNNLGFPVIPSYASDDLFTAEFPEGTETAYQAIINNIPIVLDKYTTWEQVLEFRSDRDATRKYRDLRLWLRDGLNSESIGHATDIIGQKIDNYEWAIKRHGFQTITGTLSQLFDLKKTMITTGAATASSALGGPVWGAITGGLFFTAQICVSLANRMIKLEDIKREKESEVAILYDIRKKFTTNKSQTKKI